MFHRNSTLVLNDLTEPRSSSVEISFSKNFDDFIPLITVPRKSKEMPVGFKTIV